MRVLLDATAVPADRGGVGRYVDHLAAALVRTGLDLVVACQPRDTELFAGMGVPHVVEVPVGSRPSRLAWEQARLPMVVRSVRADVVHAPHYTLPIASPRPVVVTLHDATFFTDPGVHTPLKRVFFRSSTKAALRRAARCIVPSGATRSELVRVAGADPKRVDVAYHGVDTEIFHVTSAAEKARVAASLGLGERPYVAFLGTLEPRKNVPNLVRGFASAVGPDGPALVLAGAAGWDRELDGLLASLPTSVKVMRPGYLPLADLPGFLGGAVVVAYPSLGEGFGLPVLEAMACGAPVLTTRRLALPEVGGDAVAYTDVDAESIGRDLSALIGDPARRSSLSVAAVLRASKFTWEASAAAHIQAYERACSGTR
jgi:glycosyltransferase involved in cell wall biosynthesis